MQNGRRESLLGIVAFVSGLILFIAIVGYADKPKEETPTDEPTPSVSETTESPCSPVTVDSESP